jgi:hypothetical protein
MPKRRRTDSPRFSVNDSVRVNDAIWCSQAGRVGIVLSAQISPYARTLDKYRVLVDLGEFLFFDIQLVPVAPA